MKPSRWRFLGYLLLIACVCAGLLRWYSGRRQGPFWEKYQQVQPGMTDKQVEDILGPPDDTEYPGGSLSSEYYPEWRDGKQRIVLMISWDLTGRDGAKVCEKKFYPKSAWEKVKESPHDLWGWVEEHLP